MTHHVLRVEEIEWSLVSRGQRLHVRRDGKPTPYIVKVESGWWSILHLEGESMSHVAFDLDNPERVLRACIFDHSKRTLATNSAPWKSQ